MVQTPPMLETVDPQNDIYKAAKGLKVIFIVLSAWGVF